MDGPRVPFFCVCLVLCASTSLPARVPSTQPPSRLTKGRVGGRMGTRDTASERVLRVPASAVFAFSWCRAASIFTVLWRRVSVCRPPRPPSPSSRRHESDCDSCLRLGYLACAAWQQPSFPQDPRAAAADTDEAGLFFFFFFAWFPFVASPHLPVRLRVWASTVPVHIHQHATKEQLHCHGVSWRELGRRFISGVRLHALAGTHLATMNSTGPGAGNSSASRAGLAAAACVPSAPGLPGSSIGVSPLVPD